MTATYKFNIFHSQIKKKQAELIFLLYCIIQCIPNVTISACYQYRN